MEKRHFDQNSLEKVYESIENSLEKVYYIAGVASV